MEHINQSFNYINIKKKMAEKPNKKQLPWFEANFKHSDSDV